jgi:hypothetical protein
MSQPPVSVVYAATLSLLKKESSKFKVQSSKFKVYQSSIIINNHQQPPCRIRQQPNKNPYLYTIKHYALSITHLWRITA